MLKPVGLKSEIAFTSYTPRPRTHTHNTVPLVGSMAMEGEREREREREGERERGRERERDREREINSVGSMSEFVWRETNLFERSSVCKKQGELRNRLRFQLRSIQDSQPSLPSFSGKKERRSTIIPDPLPIR